VIIDPGNLETALWFDAYWFHRWQLGARGLGAPCGWDVVLGLNSRRQDTARRRLVARSQTG